VLPSFIMYRLFLHAPQIGGVSPYLNYIAFLIPVFSALRLAKFNNDERQTESFIGLPTPANAILIGSFPLILKDDCAFLSAFILNPFFLAFFTIIMCAMLVMELPLMSLKFKNRDVQRNIYRYILLLLSAILILFFKFAAIPAIIVMYIALSIIQIRFAK
jgi:CDP-diacylglycerol---serine O-phosphatidyltransferase